MQDGISGNFSVMRDFMYAAALILGISAGLFIASLKKNAPYIKHRLVTASICVFAAAIAVAAVSVINSQKLTLITNTLVLVSLCLMAVTAVVVCFPRQLSFPFIVPTGVLIVLYAIFVMRYPATNNTDAVLAFVKLQPEDELSIIIPHPLGDAKKKIFYYNKDYTLKVFTAGVLINNYIPVAGGRRHCVLMNMYMVDKENRRIRIFSPSISIDNLYGSLIYYKFSLLDARSYNTDIPLDNFLTNVNYTIAFNGKESAAKTLVIK
ncbi:hypothetical protein FACS189494_05050 [Spirochaetia bacterium]|nr:hypothetical protein FACS189494_05050 [Spirochaetia bacterium]